MRTSLFDMIVISTKEDYFRHFITFSDVITVVRASSFSHLRASGPALKPAHLNNVTSHASVSQ